MEYYEAKPAPSAFFWRRLQSLMGLFLVIFLIEHLLTNSQSALMVGADGEGFIHAVNSIRELPYVEVIEILLIALPFLIHGIWGIQYLMTSKQNAYGYTGKDPYLPYPRNKAYTWQRITSWILVVGVLLHVVHMRFLNYPTDAKIDTQTSYMLPVTKDLGLYTLSERLGVQLYTQKELDQKIQHFSSELKNAPFSSLKQGQISEEREIEEALRLQKHDQKKVWFQAITSWKMAPEELMTVSPNFGTAELLLVRDTFKSPVMILLYSLLVLAANFHAFNGLWTFCITWGITLTARSQHLMRLFSYGLMFLVTLLGLFAIWGSALFNLKD